MWTSVVMVTLKPIVAPLMYRFNDKVMLGYVIVLAMIIFVIVGLKYVKDGK